MVYTIWSPHCEFNIQPPVMNLNHSDLDASAGEESITSAYHTSLMDLKLKLFAELHSRLKLSSISLLWSLQRSLSCRGFLQLAWSTENAPIKLRQCLIHLSQNQWRSVAQSKRLQSLEKCEQSLLCRYHFGPHHCSLRAIELLSIDILSGGSKWTRTTEAADQRQMFCLSESFIL